MSAGQAVFEHTSACTRRKSAISLSWMVLRFATRARFESFGSGTRSDPAISSITQCDQDSLIRTPSLTGSGMPNHYAGDLVPTIAISGLSRVRTELFALCVIQTLAPHPVQMHGQLAGHCYFRNLPPAPHGEVEELATPL